MKAKRPGNQLPRSMMALCCALLPAVLLGNNGDSGCGGVPAADQICVDTGGTWDVGKNVCACPPDKPDWTDGVGCQNKQAQREAQREACLRTGGSWNPNPANQCICPFSRPDWTDNLGCVLFVEGCKGTPMKCDEVATGWDAFSADVEDAAAVSEGHYYAADEVDDVFARCEAQVGCQRDTSFSWSACKGTPVPCTSFARALDCRKQKGCYWGLQ